MHLLSSCSSQHARLDRLDDLNVSTCGSNKRSYIPPLFHTLLIWGNTHYLSRWHRAFGFVTQKVERGLGSTWIGMVVGVGLGCFPKNEVRPTHKKFIWLWVSLNPSSGRSDPRSWQPAWAGDTAALKKMNNWSQRMSTGLSMSLVRIMAFEVRRLCHLCQCNSQPFTVWLCDVLRDVCMNYIWL